MDRTVRLEWPNLRNQGPTQCSLDILSMSKVYDTLLLLPNKFKLFRTSGKLLYSNLSCVGLAKY